MMDGTGSISADPPGILRAWDAGRQNKLKATATPENGSCSQLTHSLILNLACRLFSRGDLAT
jgi:hypothetical protein